MCHLSNYCFRLCGHLVSVASSSGTSLCITRATAVQLGRHLTNSSKASAFCNCVSAPAHSLTNYPIPPVTRLMVKQSTWDRFWTTHSNKFETTPKYIFGVMDLPAIKPALASPCLWVLTQPLTVTLRGSTNLLSHFLSCPVKCYCW